MAVDVGSAVGYLDLDISGFLAGLKSAQSEADKVSKNIATKIGDNISGIGKGLTTVGSTLTKTVTVPLFGVGAAGLKVATDFGKGMSEVQAISGATGEQLEALRNKALELGADTAFSANEVASAMTEMAKAGWNSQQIIDGMDGVLSAAAASGEGLASVSTIIADAITGFGLAASDSTMVADLLTQAANSGTIGIAELGESFKYIAPIAGAMGLSISDVTTALSAMSMAGIKGSQAGTSLRALITNMSKPTEQMQIAMEKLNLSITDDQGNMKDLDTIISDLRNSFTGLTEAEKAKYAATLAGKEGMSGMLALLNLTKEEYDAIAASMDDAAGVAEKTATVMQDNLSSKVEQLGGSLETLAIKLADHVIPYIQDFVVWLTELFDKFAQLDPEMQKNILKFAGIAAVVGPALLVFGKLVSVIGGVISVFGKMPGAFTKAVGGFKSAYNGVKRIGDAFTLAKAGWVGMAKESSKLGAMLAGVSGPMIAIVAVIGALVAAFVSLWKNNEEFREKMTAIWQQIKDTVSGFLDGIVERINALGFDFENITEVLGAIWKGFCDILAPVFEGAFQLIADTLDAVLGILTGLLDIFIGFFTGDWKQMWDGIVGIFKSVWDWIVSLFKNVLNTIKGIVETICNWCGTTWEATWSAIKKFFVDTWNAIKTFFVNMGNSIKDGFHKFINSVVDFFKELPYNIGKIVGQILGTIIKWNLEMQAKAKELGKKFVENVITFFTELPGKVHEFATKTFDNVKTWASNMKSKAKETGQSFLSNVSTSIKELPGKVGEYATNTINKIKTWASEMGAKGKEGAKNMFNSVVDGLLSLPDKLMEIGSNIVSGLWNGISGAAGWLADKVASFATGILDGMKEALDIHSPSRVAGDEVGRWLPPGIAEGFKAAMPSAMKSIQKDIDKGIDGIKTDDISVGADVTVLDFANKLKVIYEDVALWFESIESRINNSISNMADTLYQLMDMGQVLVNADGTLGYVGYNGFTKVAKSKNHDNDNRAGESRSNGDTFVFNSPKPIDEIEAARQMKKAKQDMAEGF